MNALALKLMAQPLRVGVLAADPLRAASLSRLVRELGHVVVDASQNASVILTDGIDATAHRRPAVALGGGGDSHEASLPADASPEQIDAALRAVAVGLSVRIAEERGSVFEAVHENDERTLLTPREVEVLSAGANSAFRATR